MTRRVSCLGTDPVLSILLHLSLPAMSSLIVNATYNVIDSFFVGHFVGIEGLGAIALAFPLFIFFVANGVLVGVGAASTISYYLGVGNEEEAHTTFGTAMFLQLFLGAMCISIFTPFASFWVSILGSESKFAYDYFFIVSLGAPFIIGSIAMNNLVYAEGNGNIAFFSLVFSSVLNVFLDWVFIVVLGAAVRGAALATLISQAVNVIILFVYFTLPISHLKFNVCVRMYQIRRILTIGISGAMRPFFLVVMGLVMNRQAEMVAGELGLAVVSVVFRVRTLIVLPVFGINQAFLSIAAYNYGAQKFGRAKSVFNQAILMALGVCYVSVLLVFIFAFPLASFFNTDPDFVALVVQGFRTAFILTPFLIFNLVSGGLYQAMAKVVQSLIVAVSRVAFFILPLMFILPTFFGLRGIWFALSFGELLSAIFALLMVIPTLNRLTGKNLVTEGCSSHA